MKRMLIFAALCAIAGPASQGQAVRETALARIPKAQAVAADAEIVRAVLAKNAAHESMEEVRRKDKDWMENAQFPLRKTLSTNACAQRLRDLVKDDPIIVEAILMDNQGANVCVSKETSDYWQGDEAKFQRTYGADKETFIDEPALDASSATYAIQLSVIVFDKKVKIGALTLTLRIRREDVGAGKGRQ